MSLFGCFVETTAPFAPNTQVQARISHNGSIFSAFGNVTHSNAGTGMGIAFTEIDESNASVLDAWLTELRK